MKNLITCDDTKDPREWARGLLFHAKKLNSQYSAGTIHTVSAERAKHIIDALSRRVLPSYYPAQIQINLTSRCSRKHFPSGDCINCSFPSDSTQEVEIGKLLDILKHFAINGGQSVFLSGGGEPGSYSHLEDLLIFLAEDPFGQMLELTLNTHGTFIKRIATLSKRGGREGKQWRSRLRTIYSGQKQDSQAMSIISISWHDDLQGEEALQLISQLRTELGLLLVIRISSLIYKDPSNLTEEAVFSKNEIGGLAFDMTTSIEQMKRIIYLAQLNNADVISFKPAHVNNAGLRFFVSNEPAYNFVKSQIDAQNFQAHINDWDWQICKHMEDFSIFFEESPRLNRLTKLYQQAAISLKDSEIFCVAPLVMMFLAPEGFAACCDTWDEGLGNTPPFLLTNKIQSPPAFYLSMLYWILTSIKDYWPRYCVLGCGWTEFNLVNSLNPWAKSLMKQINLLHSDSEEVWQKILNHFGENLPAEICDQAEPATALYKDSFNTIIPLISIKLK